MNPARILVVDDNPTNLKLASDVLEFEGYQIFQAGDAEEALLIIQRLPPDLILMDIALPGMDGLTLTRLLKAEAKTQSIVIVALTAFAMKGDETKARAAGCDGYITKPIDTRKLAGLVAGHLARRQTPATEIPRVAGPSPSGPRTAASAPDLTDERPALPPIQAAPPVIPVN